MGGTSGVAAGTDLFIEVLLEMGMKAGGPSAILF